jgi:hypothetical protein
MANFSVVIDSKFDPFSYEELIKPIDRQNTEHRLIEQGIAELDTQASILENMADMEKDPVSYARYKQYALDLREKSAILAARGLDGTNRQDMYNMKSRYAKEIVPIQTAYATRKAQEEEQRKLQAQDDTIRFSYNAGERSLDDFLLDPSLSYNSYKGSTIEKQVSDAAKNIKTELRDNKSYWSKILGNQYYEHIMRYGLTADEVLNTITGIENGTNTGFAPLRDLIMSSVDGIGLKNWKGLTNEDGTLNEKGRELYSDALYYAGRGAYSSIGTTEFKELANKDYEENLKAKKAEAEKKKRLVKAWSKTENVNVNGDTKTTEAANIIKEVQDLVATRKPISKEKLKREEFVKDYNNAHQVLVNGVPTMVTPIDRPVTREIKSADYINEKLATLGIDLKDLGIESKDLFNSDGTINTKNAAIVVRGLNDYIENAAELDVTATLSPNMAKTAGSVVSSIIKGVNPTGKDWKKEDSIYLRNNLNDKFERVNAESLQNFLDANDDVSINYDFGDNKNLKINKGKQTLKIDISRYLDSPANNHLYKNLIEEYDKAKKEKRYSDATKISKLILNSLASDLDLDVAPEQSDSDSKAFDTVYEY